MPRSACPAGALVSSRIAGGTPAGCLIRVRQCVRLICRTREDRKKKATFHTTPALASPRTALPPAAPHTSDGRAREATSPAASIGRAAKAGSNGWAKSSEDWFKRLVGSEGE